MDSYYLPLIIIIFKFSILCFCYTHKSLYRIFKTVALGHLLTMPVLYNNQTIKLPFDISKLDNLYQPYRYTEYNDIVCDDTC